MMKPVLLSLLALTLLAGCGVRGGLERPAPMWGEERDRYLQQQAAEQAEEEARESREAAEARQVTPAPPEPSAARPPETPTDVAPPTPQ